MTQDTLSCSAVSELAALLDSPQIKALISDLDETRWTGRPGYPIRSMVGIALAKSRYAIPTWTKTISLIKEHKSLSKIIAPDGEIPSVFACYRFTKKMIEYEHIVEKCIERVVTAHKDKNETFGNNIAIDGSDLPAYANGQRLVHRNGPEREKFSDPDASWGRRSAISTRKSGWYYGYKIHAAVDTITGLPLAWEIHTATSAEMNIALDLVDKARSRGLEINACIMDKGYDGGFIYDGCEERDIRPIVPLMKTIAVKRGDHEPPCCEHGEWKFAGSDYKRKATKWLCPTEECATKSKWIKASRLHTLIPRSTRRWKKLYNSRTAVEREFGRLKHEWAMLPLRIRGLKKVKLHVDLTILTRLSCALLKA
jgi:transposase, IS5 family